MDFMPHTGTPPHPGRRLGRILLAAVAVGGVALGAASVLARPTSGSARAPVRAARVDAQPSRLVGLPANADLDIGPGSDEAQLANVPEARR